MDILVDVKKAEEEADRLEQEYRRKAEQLLASADAELQQKRLELEADLQRELEQYQAELERSSRGEADTAVKQAQEERQTVESTAKSKVASVAAHLLQELEQ